MNHFALNITLINTYDRNGYDNESERGVKARKRTSARVEWKLFIFNVWWVDCLWLILLFFLDKIELDNVPWDLLIYFN